MQNGVPSLTVLIVDDHDLFAESVQAFLSTESGIAVVGRAANGEQGTRLAAEMRPDVVLMDISMPVMDGFEATRRIRAEDDDVAVLMLTGSNARADVDRAREAGAAAYVTKDRIAAELIEAILEVAPR